MPEPVGAPRLREPPKAGQEEHQEGHGQVSLVEAPPHAEGQRQQTRAPPAGPAPQQAQSSHLAPGHSLRAKAPSLLERSGEVRRGVSASGALSPIEPSAHQCMLMPFRLGAPHVQTQTRRTRGHMGAGFRFRGFMGEEHGGLTVASWYCSGARPQHRGGGPCGGPGTPG